MPHSNVPGPLFAAFGWPRLSTAALLTLLIAGALAAASARADDIDYHGRFEALCGHCHGHSGPFARDNLVIVDGELIGRATGVPVARFLRRHPGRLPPGDIARFRDVMYRQVEAGGVFQEKCAICHGRAVELAAVNLSLSDGVLRVRYDGTPVRDYLSGHGRLDEHEVETVLAALREIVALR